MPEVRVLKLKGGKEVLLDEQIYHMAKMFPWVHCPKTKSIFFTKNEGGGKWRTIRLSRFIMGAKDPNLFVDHINGDIFDNRASNLRVCLQKQNCRNRKPHHNKKYKGPHQYAPGKWRATICMDRKRIHLGCFSSEIAAARAYDQAAIKYHGEFARLNFPDESKISR